jgi:hypothetical protein
MSHVDGPFKVLEKINDNAYKLKLPPEFRLVLHLTFHIYDLTCDKKMRFYRGRRQFKRGRMMRTSLRWIQALLLLKCRTNYEITSTTTTSSGKLVLMFVHQ